MKIEDLEKICAQATSGPWHAGDDGSIHSSTATEYNDVFKCQDDRFIGATKFFTDSNSDARFIASARTLIPKLIAVALATAEFIESYEYMAGPPTAGRYGKMKRALEDLEKDE